MPGLCLRGEGISLTSADRGCMTLLKSHSSVAGSSYIRLLLSVKRRSWLETSYRSDLSPGSQKADQQPAGTCVHRRSKRRTGQIG